MTDARVEKADLVGRLGPGLGDRADHAVLRARRQLARAGDPLRRRVPPAGQGGADAPSAAAGRSWRTRWCARKLGRIYADLEVQRYAALRILSALEKGESPGAAASITKLSYSEFEKRYHELVQEILGPWGQAMSGVGRRLRGGRHVLGRAGHLGDGVPLVPRGDDLRGLLGDPEEHHRRARARAAEGGARRPGRGPRRPPWTSPSARTSSCCAARPARSSTSR